MEIKHTVPGCAISRGDLPLIIASVACFVSFITYGAAVGSLGASIPELSRRFDRSESAFGAVFTARGVGYFCGTIGSGLLLKMNFNVTMEFYTTLAIAFTGLATGLVMATNHDKFSVILFLFWMQGLGFGGVDTMGNCLMPELWTSRVQPWMQAMHSCFGIGAFIGPALVGVLGSELAYVVISVSSVMPCLGILIWNFMYGSRKLSDIQSVCEEDDVSEKTNDVNHVDVKAEDEDHHGKVAMKEAPLKDMPLLIQILMALFFFFYVGVEIGFGGWLSSYSMQVGVADTHSNAAFLASVYWAAFAIGRVVAIPTAVYVSTTNMMRFQLGLSSVGCILILTISSISYSCACISSAALGFAISSIFPLAMTLAGDYGIFMDTTTTTIFIIASTCGESAIPACIGLLIAKMGPYALPLSVTSMLALNVLLYVSIHKLLLTRYKNISLPENVSVITANSTSYNPIQAQSVDQVALQSSLPIRDGTASAASRLFNTVPDFVIGSRVVGFDGNVGTVRYIGPVTNSAKNESDDTRIGVEWDKLGRGKNDGSFVDGDGIRQTYFICDENMGSFVKPTNLKILPVATVTTSASTMAENL